MTTFSSVRIVTVADTHMYHEELTIPQGDVFIHAGDLGQAGTENEIQKSLTWLRALPHPVKILVAGNHDCVFERRPEEARKWCAPDIVYLEDESFFAFGLHFWGSPWQPPFAGWAFGCSTAARRKHWERIPPGVDVLVTHTPPYGTGDGGPSGQRYGCPELAARLAQVKPKLHVFGHIHEGRGVWVRDGIILANVTTQESCCPPVVFDVNIVNGKKQFSLVSF